MCSMNKPHDCHTNPHSFRNNHNHNKYEWKKASNNWERPEEKECESQQPTMETERFDEVRIIGWMKKNMKKGEFFFYMYL